MDARSERECALGLEDESLWECGDESPWGRGDGACLGAVGAVAARLGAEDAGRMAAVCRAWRRAVSQPHVWRRVLAGKHGLSAARLRAMASVAAERGVRWSWREEATLAAAGWAKGATLQPERGVTLHHAALIADGTLLAIAADDASVSVWEWSSDESWVACERCSLRELGWASAARVEWSPDGARLLAAGPLVLAPRWELAVLRRGALRVGARGGCGPGGAAAWLGGAAVLTLELRRAGPMLATTVVWVYAAEQETHSEHTGVAAPLLRLYNEGRTHFTHVMVAPDRWSAATDAGEPSSSASPDIHTEYYRQTLTESASGCDTTCSGQPLLVLAGGPLGGTGGATSVHCWPLAACRPPPLAALAAGDLRSRRAALPRRPSRPPSPPPPPSEPELRALCCPPSASTDLGARVCGLVMHPGGRCMWAALEDGRMVNVALPRLSILRVLGGGSGVSRASGAGGTPYLQPAASPLLLACPLVDGGVRLWCARSGAECVGPESGSGVRGAPLMQAGLRGGGRRLLLLGGDRLQEWHSRAPLLDEDGLD